MVAKKPRIVIIGAGMAGLTAANHLYTTAGDLIDISILEAGPRIGGRILTSEFVGDRIEMGATWIHGIGGSPIYSIANKINALSTGKSYERMDGFPEDPVTLYQGTGAILRPSFVEPISNLYKDLVDSAREGNITAASAGAGVGDYLRNGLKENYRGNLSAAVEAVFEMEMNKERAHTSADDLNDLNVATESEYKEFPGDQITIAKGYSRIIETLAAALPEDVIQLCSTVNRIEWCNEDGQVRIHVDGEVVTCDHVIVTVSLGVLKAGLKKKEAGCGSSLEFLPELPGFKKEAIGRLGFGVVDKLFMEVDGGGGDEPFPFVQLAFDGRENGGHMAKIPWWMRKTASVCPIYARSNVVLAWLAGQEAMKMEELGEEEIISGVHATLDGFLAGGRGGEHGRRIVRVKRSGWGKNPLFMGSYSYVAVGSSGDDLDLMAEPLPYGEMDGVAPLQVLFAGEATHRTYYSTTHGAYFSGIREANRLLQQYHRQR